jgi:hypothetical protein
VLCTGVGGVTFVTSICEGGYVALDSFEGFLGTFYVLFVVVPFCGFFGEARVVNVLVCHCFDRLAERSLCTGSSMVLGLGVRHGGGCGVESAMRGNFSDVTERAPQSLPHLEFEI